MLMRRFSPKAENGGAEKSRCTLAGLESRLRPAISTGGTSTRMRYANEGTAHGRRDEDVLFSAAISLPAAEPPSGRVPKAVPANNRPSAPRRVIGIEGPSGPCFFNQNLRDKPNSIRGPSR